MGLAFGDFLNLSLQLLCFQLCDVPSLSVCTGHLPLGPEEETSDCFEEGKDLVVV